MKLAILGLACVVAAAQTTAHSGQTVSYQYAVGQELGFGGPEAEGEESGSAVTPAVLDRLRREAGAGKKDALYYLGVVYFYGDGVKKDVPAAVGYFRKAGDAGHVLAMVNLGLVLLSGWPAGSGDGVDGKDIVGAGEWLGRGAAYGDANAQWMLGKMHYDGLLAPSPDMKEAMKLFHLSAQQGNSNGQFYVGLLTEYGWAVPRSYAGAATWYKLAADQRHPEAMYNLGLMHAYGRGVGKDYLRAAMLFENACGMLHGPSCLMLGAMNLYGNGFPVDYDAALVWMQKAQRTNDTRVKEAADKGVRELTEKLEQARVYFDKANTAHAAPERLPYVNVPKTREEREQARKIAAAVGDAQARAKAQKKFPQPSPDAEL